MIAYHGTTSVLTTHSLLNGLGMPGQSIFLTASRGLAVQYAYAKAERIASAGLERRGVIFIVATDQWTPLDEWQVRGPIRVEAALELDFEPRTTGAVTRAIHRRFGEICDPLDPPLTQFEDRLLTTAAKRLRAIPRERLSLAGERIVTSVPTDADVALCESWPQAMARNVWSPMTRSRGVSLHAW